MSFDINNNMTGQLFGKDRVGHTTPDMEASDVLRPFLPVSYPAPYLPTLRQDQGHPVLAPKVLTSQQLIGIDKSGAIVPAGYFCGTTSRLGAFTINNAALTSNVATFTTSATHNYVVGDSVIVTITGTGSDLSGTYTVASTPSGTTYTVALTHANVTSEAVTGTSVLAVQGQYCIIVYDSTSVGMSVNPQTGARVANVGEHVVLAAPSDAVAGTVTLPNGAVVSVSSGDITFAHSCTLFDGGVVKPIAVMTRDVYQYIGGTAVLSTTGGITYRVDGVVPNGRVVNNFVYEMGTAVQTQYILRVPWIGATPQTLATLATGDGVTGYSQGYGLTFAHFTGNPVRGARVAASRFAQDFGNYTTFNSAVNDLGDECGRIIGVVNMIDRIGFSSRVRTLWDPTRLTGPIKDPNPASIQMGGSATGGLPYDINLTTDGIYKRALLQNKSTAHPEYGSYVLLRINL